MHSKWKFALIGGLAMALAGCGTSTVAPSDENSSAAPAAQPPASTDASAASTTTTTTTVTAGAAPAAFTQCRACHLTEAGKTLIGPSLAGVVGRKAGTLPGFAYSDQLKAAGPTWDDATLDTWLTSPSKMVPGTKMTFAGLSDPAQRKAVIEYLKTLK